MCVCGCVGVGVWVCVWVPVTDPRIFNRGGGGAIQKVKFGQ